MNKTKAFLKEHSGQIFFILFILQALVVYKLIQDFLSIKNIWAIGWDSEIPFIPWFIAPYLLFYLFLFLPFILSYKNKKLFTKLSLTYFIAASILNIFYLIFRTGIIRPEFEVRGLATQAISIFYSVDGVLNAFPSGHVTLSVLTNLCLLDINKKSAVCFLPLTVLIVLSTLFIKQHYIVDVVGGIALALFSYFFIFKKILKSK